MFRISNFYYKFRRVWKAIKLYFIISGPGIVVMVADNDAGGITTYAATGAKYGYSLIWFLINLVPVAYYVQEMTVRLGLSYVAEFIYHLAEVFKKETISWSYVQRLPEKMGSFKGNVKLNILKETLPEIQPVDLADILGELPEEQRIAIFNELETEHASDTLEEIEPRVQRAIISSLSTERNAELVGDMTPAQAADAHVVDYLYVTGPDSRLMGVVSLDELLTAEPGTPLSDIMSTQVISLDTGDSVSDFSTPAFSFR